MLRRGTAALAVVIAATSGCEATAPRYPACADCNVVVISVDTLRADRVGALGYGRGTTPNIDALAARGVLFENAISQSSWTRPAHMSIFTGLFPSEHGFVALADTRRLDESIPTLAGVLREHGYRTAAFTGGVNLAGSYGFDQGFDVYRTSGKHFRDNLEDTSHWLATRPDGKFLLFLHGYDAHTPYLTDQIDREALSLPASVPALTLAETCRADGPASRIQPYMDEYDGAVHRADRYVGELVKELERHDLMEKTILVVTSDHGEEFLEHGRCFHISTLYREVLHVPLVFVAPNLASARVPDPVAASVTIAPTLMEMLGIDSHPFPGPSLLDAATGGPVPDEPIVSETERNVVKKGEGHVRSLTTATHKLLHWTTRERQALFDVKADPGERHALDQPALRESLGRVLEEWTASHPERAAPRRQGSTRAKGSDAAPADEKADLEADRQRRQQQEDLRSLGYAD